MRRFFNEEKRLRISCFYKAYGGPAHPAQIFLFDKNHKTYISIKFGTSKGRHMTKIHPIQRGYEISYVRNRPFEGTKEDYDDEELIGFKVDPRDAELIETIKARTPDRSRKARKRYKK